MFINESILKGHRRNKKSIVKAQPNISKEPELVPAQRTLTLGETYANTRTDAMMPLSEIQFEEVIWGNLDSLLKKWQDSLSRVEADLKPFEHIPQRESEQQAYLQCSYIIEKEFSNDSQAHENDCKVITMKIMQIDDFKLRIRKQIEQLRVENQSISGEIEEHDRKLAQEEKKKVARGDVIRAIEQEKQKMEQLTLKIQECKNKSHAQKNEFIEHQEEEFRLEQDLAKLGQEERDYELAVEREVKYEKLLRVKEKIMESRWGVEAEVRPHLERKISKMARLRSDLKEVEEVLESCWVKIQDQNFILDALKEKAYVCELQNEEDTYSLYKKKYDELYLSKDANNNWEQYKNYLKHLTDRNKRNNDRAVTEVGLSAYRSVAESNVVDVMPYRSKRETKEKFHTNPRNNTAKKKPSSYSEAESKVTKLPRLVKMPGKASDPKNSKQNIKARIEQKQKKGEASDFELESIPSDASQVSGEIIEVEFHKRLKDS